MCTIVLVLPINITKLQKEFQKQTQLNFIKKLRKAHILQPHMILKHKHIFWCITHSFLQLNKKEKANLQMGSNLFLLVKTVLDSTTMSAPAWPMGSLLGSWKISSFKQRHSNSKTHFQSSNYKMKTEKKCSDGFLTEEKALCFFFFFLFYFLFYFFIVIFF